MTRYEYFPASENFFQLDTLPENYHIRVWAHHNSKAIDNLLNYHKNIGKLEKLMKGGIDDEGNFGSLFVVFFFILVGIFIVSFVVSFAVFFAGFLTCGNVTMQGIEVWEITLLWYMGRYLRASGHEKVLGPYRRVSFVQAMKPLVKWLK
ncbi:hypothetical protein F4819DRAFT_492820 [Hypoxylon fuscum]|nr:hypothetical protein F4819DRAFT_492820 [Hypoxylon fuscum]